MPLDLTPFPTLTEADLLPRLLALRNTVAPKLNRYLGYYSNPATDLATYLPGPKNAALSVRPYRQYQELGLPSRITGFRTALDGATSPLGPVDLQRKEVVIENDIAWRLNTLVDFTAGIAPTTRSLAANPATQKQIQAVVATLLDANGGLAFLQKLTLLGAIHGSAFILLHPSDQMLAAVQGQGVEGSSTGAHIPPARPPSLDPSTPNPSTLVSSTTPPSTTQSSVLSTQSSLSLPTDPVSTPTDTPPQPANGVPLPHLQIVEASRVLPIFHATPQGSCGENDLAYLAVLHPNTTNTQSPSTLARLTAWLFGNPPALTTTPPSFDLFSPTAWARYVDGVLTASGPNPFGFVPAVPYINQLLPTTGACNTSETNAYPDTLTLGASDVEPLIPLQDELNTRLSDRANRITLQSFRMYLAKGIEDFIKRPVGPGQMWATDNPNAAIDSFGGDAATPSEDNHIQDIRNALDKTSGVTPIAAGLIAGNIGHLTSAVALKITLIATLSRTQRKRAALTRTLQTLIRHTLNMLNTANLLHTTADDRLIDLNFSSPLPENDMDKLQEAQLKLQLGVDKQTVLHELGY